MINGAYTLYIILFYAFSLTRITYQLYFISHPFCTLDAQIPERMKNIYSLSLFLCFITPRIFSQSTIDVSYAVDKSGNMVFSCNNRAFCPYVVKVDVTTMDNLKTDHTLPYEAEIKPGISKLFTLTTIDKGKDIQVKYKTSYRKGLIQPVIDPNFTYLLPFAPGKEAQAYRIENHGSAGDERDSGYAIRVRMKPGDTIYAARRGVVTAVSVSNAENDAGVNVTEGWNYIEIFHKDGSFGEYGVVKKDGALVKPGQTVEAGTPIGIVGGDKYGRGSDIRFSVSYYPGQINTAEPLHCWVKGNGKLMLKHGGTYTSEYPRAILMQEMSKPPVKKVKKK